jgi:hypothetical protein
MRPGDPGGSELVEAAARLAGVRGLVLPPSCDPVHVFKAIKHSVDRGAAPVREPHDGVTVKLEVMVIDGLQQDLQDVQERLSDPLGLCHDA